MLCRNHPYQQLARRSAASPTPCPFVERASGPAAHPLRLARSRTVHHAPVDGSSRPPPRMELGGVRQITYTRRGAWQSLPRALRQGRTWASRTRLRA